MVKRKRKKKTLLSKFPHLTAPVLVAVLLLTYCVNRSTTSVSNNVVEAARYDYTVKVTKVSDGDTFRGTTKEGDDVRFRIYGIDAPESKQAFGKESAAFLAEMIFEKEVGIVVQTQRDRYGRPIVWVYTPEGKDVSTEMLKAGMAWHYKAYDKTEAYANYESEAKAKQLGLWAAKKPTAPWDYRKSKKKAK